MTKRLKILRLLILVAGILIGCDFAMAGYSNKAHGFSLLLPRAWEQEEGFQNTVILARAPEKNPRFQTNINVNTGNLADIQNQLGRKISFTEFYEVNKAQLMAILPGIKSDIQEGEIFAGNQRGTTLSFNNNLEALNLKFLVGIWMKQERVYIISCSTEASKFPKYLPIFKKVLQSLRISKI